MNQPTKIMDILRVCLSDKVAAQFNWLKINAFLGPLYVTMPQIIIMYYTQSYI